MKAKYFLIFVVCVLIYCIPLGAVISISNKLDIKNPIIRINTGFKGYSSTKKVTILPRIYHN